MPHSLGGGSHSGGSSSSSFSRSGGSHLGGSTHTVSRTYFAGARRYAYYDDSHQINYVYSDTDITKSQNLLV